MAYLSLLAETPSAVEPSIFPRDDDTDDAELYPEERQNVKFISNYYFLIIILAVLILVAIWLIHRRKGLDERGEAPPPYQPKSEVSSTTIAIPLRILPADGSERSLPPQYKALP
ncbi:hypothetical protein J4E86_007245 [Alternaria arbusti]|uniref:uncharacterized protein n=1 Tax=Alternaria arbusti TaxID=232088 RepID=UPI00221E64D5|nr:uncharacterized protein J4E86_007245 [Alternaria arbusti]KAI4951829.1 hypothetical protein J4E86_007245 [Alternaria arbusti]